MLEITDLERWQISKRYTLRTLDVEKKLYWLFDIEDGTCFNLNDTSCFILQSFDGKSSISDVYQKVLSKYKEEDVDAVSKDFYEFFNKAKELKILEPTR